MTSSLRTCPLVWGLVALSGCGLTVPQIAESYDIAFNPNATQDMERQIKQAVYCELKQAVYQVRGGTKTRYFERGSLQNTNVDGPLPDYWGAQVTLTFTVDESMAFSPGATLNTPMHDAPVNFVGQLVDGDALTSAISYGPKALSQSYAFGLGGKLSSDANRIDVYNSYYTIQELSRQPPPQLPPDQYICGPVYDDSNLGPRSHSSPFLISGNLGVRDWLVQAWPVTSYLRSTRAEEKVAGLPVATFSGGSADVMSYHIKFEIVSNGSVTPSWSLVRVSTTSNPLFSAERKRTHDLLVTVGPGSVLPKVTRAGIPYFAAGPYPAPSASATAIHNSQLFESAVAAALRTNSR